MLNINGHFKLPTCEPSALPVKFLSLFKRAQVLLLAYKSIESENHEANWHCITAIVFSTVILGGKNSSTHVSPVTVIPRRWTDKWRMKQLSFWYAIKQYNEVTDKITIPQWIFILIRGAILCGPWLLNFFSENRGSSLRCWEFDSRLSFSGSRSGF